MLNNDIIRILTAICPTVTDDKTTYDVVWQATGGKLTLNFKSKKNGATPLLNKELIKKVTTAISPLNIPADDIKKLETEGVILTFPLRQLSFFKLINSIIEEYERFEIQNGRPHDEQEYRSANTQFERRITEPRYKLTSDQQILAKQILSLVLTSNQQPIAVQKAPVIREEYKATTQQTQKTGTGTASTISQFFASLNCCGSKQEEDEYLKLTF